MSQLRVGSSGKKGGYVFTNISHQRNLNGVKVAILVDNGFEQVEMTDPREALDQSGAETKIISPASGHVLGWKFTEWGDEFPIDVPLDQAGPQDYDALMLPGGVMNSDKLRKRQKSVDFAKSFFIDGKPVAARCHRPLTIIEAGEAKGRRMTSWPSLKTDLLNAGAGWLDKALVSDGNLVTSRKPDDIPAFNEGMIELLARARRKDERAHQIA
ncbi:MAG TPA: type 1 glutamine amidotransferase domain-containing protein [Nitrososphaerales archaeon]|nr:type 1 glutamine amidotransferase domain-containing protein [Nitrososphaerales archaeon]